MNAEEKRMYQASITTQLRVSSYNSGMNTEEIDTP